MFKLDEEEIDKFNSALNSEICQKEFSTEVVCDGKAMKLNEYYSEHRKDCKKHKLVVKCRDHDHKTGK